MNQDDKIINEEQNYKKIISEALKILTKISDKISP